jgi:rfaE bifunctional protein kinase chain/domain
MRERLLGLLEEMPRASVLLVGDLVLDRFILGTPKRISREAPVIILRWEGQRDVPGGAGNALANLADLDVHVRAVGAVGDDEPGGCLRAALASHGVDTSAIRTVPGYRTPTKVRLLGGGPGSLKHQVARYDIEDTLPADGAWRRQLEATLREAAAAGTVVAVSDYGYGAARPEVVELMRTLRPEPAWICVDSRYRLVDFEGVDAATPNLQELESSAGRTLHGDDDVAAAAESLRRRLGARFLLATRGNLGMTLTEADRPPDHIPVFGADEVADVTGAGDTVLAVLCAALAAGGTPAEAARLANYAGGIVVMKRGTATVSRDEIRRAVERDLMAKASG